MPNFSPSSSCSNIPPLVNEDDLKEFLEDCGTILELALPRKKGTNEIKVRQAKHTHSAVVECLQIQAMAGYYEAWARAGIVCVSV